jgi:hypothetical protein
MISFNIVYVACQVGNYLYKYIYCIDKLKEIFKFWAMGCHVKGPLHPPPHTRHCYKELRVPDQYLGGHDMAGSIFPPGFLNMPGLFLRGTPTVFLFPNGAYLKGTLFLPSDLSHA